MIRRFTGAFALAWLCAGPVLAQTRAEVPIQPHVGPAGVIRYTIPVTIGQAEVQAMVETGATGLRLTPEATAAANYQASGKGGSFSYPSGLKLTGEKATAKLAIGGQAAAEPASLLVVQDAACAGKRPLCEAMLAGSKAAQAQGINAQIGINMSGGDENPLVEVGAKRWIVELPSGGQAGRLILNPTDAETADFMLFKLNPVLAQGRNPFHDAITACLIDTKVKRKFCGAALMDTASSGVYVTPAPREPREAWPSGSDAALVFLNEQKEMLAAGFSTDQGPTTRLTILPASPFPATFISAGSLPFQAYAVLYDPTAGVVGLRKR